MLTDPTLVVTDPLALAAVAEAGGDFARLVAAHPEPADNAALQASGAYRSIVQPITASVRAIAARDPKAGVGIRGNAHRLFDERWLSSPHARFELIAVVNRIDRRVFEPAGCGEIRLVYRLGYDRMDGAVRLASRLPMTIAAELRAHAGGGGPDACTRAAQRWFAPAGLVGRELGAWLVGASGPLGGGALDRARLVQLSVNLQTVRWPSAVRPDLGGHAEYALRAFSWDAAGGGRYRPRKLENTPDVARLARDPALKARLRQWLADPAQLAALDRAVTKLPEDFLAEEAVSVTANAAATATASASGERH